MESLQALAGDLIQYVESAGKVVFFSHDNMDPDAIGAIVGLTELFYARSSRPVVVVVAGGKISRQAKKFLGSLPYSLDIVNTVDLGDDWVPVIVDSQSLHPAFPSRDASASVYQARAIVIDHHVATSNIPCRLRIVDPSAQSTCEIVYSLWKATGDSLPTIAASALAGGVLFDSGFLNHATGGSISTLADLVRFGVDLPGIRLSLKETMAFSEKVARLKACSRASIIKLDPFVIVSSEVSSFESSACRALIQAGADVSIVVAENKDDVRISARQTEAFFKRFGVNLALVMRDAAVEMGGVGGGHQMAAAANGAKAGKPAMDKAIKAILDIVKASDG